MSKLENYSVKKITRDGAKPFILNLHYAQRMPSISYAFGLFDNQELIGVVTFGKSASPSLDRGIMGEEFKSHVIELNRLILKEGLPKNSASYFVSRALKQLKPYNLCVVSFSDLGMSHNGYIYQALNFIYTGTSKERTDKYSGKGKHSRHYDKDAKEVYRRIRTAKRRYVYFACDKTHKKKFKENLNYPILPYPKAENKRYVLGEKQSNWLKEVETGKIIKEENI